MKIKKVIQGYFSPTGTAEQVVRCLCERMGALTEDCDLLPKVFEGASFDREELLVLGVPVFGGRVPSVAAERIARLSGDHTPAVAVAAYGNRAYEDTLAELQDLLQSRGFVVVAAVAAVTEHSIVREIASGQPDDQSCEVLRGFGEKIAAMLGGKESPISVENIPGDRPYKDYKVLPVTPETSADCVACGDCASVCPVGAIDAGDPSSTDAEICISCMACIARCPQGARGVPKEAHAMLLKKLQAACGDTVKANALFI
ncbi:MAG: 4Fe-4S binding protein [Eubacterium sp.]|nr:4Fe-4S binding protein [Eubacterium sp.]